MDYRNYEAYSKPISAITFGGASLSGEGGGYGFGEMSEKDAEALIKNAVDVGITVFDTAPIYGFGFSEERLGKYLPKDSLVVSKCGVDWHENKRVNMTNDPVVARKMFHESLKRLNRDLIDIYMVHWPDAKVDIRKTLEVLAEEQRQGKIKHIGLCNTNLEELKKAKEVCDIQVVQSELNLFNQESFTRLDNEWKDKLTMGWGTFDKGILSGRVTRERKFDKSDARSWAPWWNRKDVAVKIERVEKLEKILSDYNISLTHFCVQYSLQYFGISSCIIGFKSVGDLVQVTSNLQQNIMRERIEEVLKRFHT